MVNNKTSILFYNFFNCNVLHIVRNVIYMYLICILVKLLIRIIPTELYACVANQRICWNKANTKIALYFIGS